MKIFIALFVVFVASILIFRLNGLASKMNFTISKNDYINNHAKYQVLLSLLSMFVLLLLYFQSSENLQLFLSIGDISANAEPVYWFGIEDNKTWIFVGLYLCALITMGTLSFVYIQFKNSKIKLQELVPFIAWIIIFSLANSLSEEIIYRLGIIVPLFNHISTTEVIWLSAIIFGLVHFGGMPHGLIGMFMAGFLGWFLAKAVIETEGIFWAWFIHFIQDIVIYFGFIIGNLSTNNKESID